MTFGERLKRLREEKKLTQAELADILNKSRPTIAGYEIDDRQPDFETLIKIADYFNVSTDYLLGKTDIRNRIEEISYKRKNGEIKTLQEVIEDFEKSFKELGIIETGDPDVKLIEMLVKLIKQTGEPFKYSEDEKDNK